MPTAAAESFDGVALAEPEVPLADEDVAPPVVELANTEPDAVWFLARFATMTFIAPSCSDMPVRPSKCGFVQWEPQLSLPRRLHCRAAAFAVDASQVEIVSVMLLLLLPSVAGSWI